MKNKFTIMNSTTHVATKMFCLDEVIDMLSQSDIDAEAFLTKVSCVSKFYDIIIDNNTIYIVDKE